MVTRENGMCLFYYQHSLSNNLNVLFPTNKHFLSFFFLIIWQFKKNLYFILQGNNPCFGFLFDIDGVIVRGKRLLPSAKEAFRLLTDEYGKFRVPALFVTNAGNMLRQEKAKQLSNWLGIQVCMRKYIKKFT